MDAEHDLVLGGRGSRGPGPAALVSTSSESIWREISAPSTWGGTATLPQSPVSRSSWLQRLSGHALPEAAQRRDPGRQVRVGASRCVGQERGPDVVEAFVEGDGGAHEVDRRDGVLPYART